MNTTQLMGPFLSDQGLCNFVYEPLHSLCLTHIYAVGTIYRAHMIYVSIYIK